MQTHETEIRTDRLTLRLLTVEDMDWIRVLCNNYKIAKNMCTMPYPYDDEAAASFAEKIRDMRKSDSDYAFSISTDAPMGLIGIHDRKDKGWLVGYWLGEPYWGKGYATEAARAIVEFAFNNLSVEKLYADYCFDNPASGRVLVKSGFCETGKSELQPCMARGMDIECHMLEYQRNVWLSDQGKSNA